MKETKIVARPRQLSDNDSRPMQQFDEAAATHFGRAGYKCGVYLLTTNTKDSIVRRYTRRLRVMW